MSRETFKPLTFYRYFPKSPRDRKWGLYVTTAGETRIGPNEERYPPLGHPRGYDFNWRHGRVLREYTLVCISRGRGWFETRRQPRRGIEAGTVLLLFPGVWHRYRPDRKTGWDEHWVGFDGDIPRRWMKHGFFSPGNPILKPGHEELLLTLFTRIVGAIKTNQPALQQVMAGTVCEMMGLLYSAQQGGLTRQQESMDAVQHTIERMQTDLAVPVDLPQVAQDLGVSYSWLRRTFAEHTGLAPHQYWLELRLVRARNLLSQTLLTVKEAARQVGFEDEHYFCRLFRKKTGFTPGQWRAGAQQPNWRPSTRLDTLL
jgi:AraC-like DNA-binding protein